MQIERAGLALADQCHRQGVPLCHRRPQLAGEDAGTGQAEAAAWRDQQVAEILFHALEIELPGNRPGARGRGAEGREFSPGAADTEPVKQPIGMRQALRGVPLRPIRIGRRIIGDGDLGRRGSGRRVRRKLRTDRARGRIGLWRRGRLFPGGAIGAGLSGLGMQPSQQRLGSFVGLQGSSLPGFGGAAHAATFIPGRRVRRGARRARIRRIASVPRR